MNRSSFFQALLLVILAGILLIFTLGACSSTPESTQSAITQPSRTPEAEIRPTEKPDSREIIAAASTPTDPLPQPSDTPEPSPTPTRLPADPWGRMTYSLPELAGPITASNFGVEPLALWGRSDPKAMAFSPNGSLIGIDTYAGPFIYDAYSMAPVQFDDELYVQIFPNGNLYLTNNFTNMVLYKDGDLVLEEPGFPSALSPNGRYVAGHNGEEGTITVYSTQDGKPTGAINLSELDECLMEDWEGKPIIFLISFAVAENGKTLAILCGNDELSIYNTEDGEKISTLDQSAFTSDLQSGFFQFSPDGSHIAVNIMDTSGEWYRNKTGIWKTEDGSFVSLLSGIDLPFDRKDMAFSPDNTKLLVSLTGGQVFLLDIRQPDDPYPLHPEEPGSRDLDFSPDGSKLLIPFVNHFAIIDSTTGKILEDVVLEEEYATYGDCEEFVFSADSSRLYCTATNLLVWDLENLAGSQNLGEPGSELKEVPGEAAIALVREHLMLLDPADGKPIDKILLSDRSRDTYDFSANATLLALGEFGGVQILERNEFNKYKIFEQIEVERPDLLRFSPDDSRLAVIDHHNLRLFDSETWEQVGYWESEFPVIKDWENYQLPGFYDLAFSPDGSLLATGAGKDIHLRSAERGELLRTLSGHNYLVSALAFSPDGTLLASLSWDGTLRLWGIP